MKIMKPNSVQTFLKTGLLSLFFTCLMFVSEGQTLWIERSEAFDHKFLQGQIMEDRLLIYGSKGHFEASSKDSLYAVSLGITSGSIEPASFLEKETGVYLDVLKADNSFYVANGALINGDYRGKVRRYSLQGELQNSFSDYSELVGTPRNLIKNDDAVYVAGSIVNHPNIKKPFFVYSLNESLNVIDSIVLSQSNDFPVYMCNFLDVDSTLFLFHTNSWEPNQQLLAYTFLKTDLQKMDSLLIIDGYFPFPNYNVGIGVPSVIWDKQGESIYSGLQVRNTIGNLEFSKDFALCNYNLNGAQNAYNIISREDTSDWMQGQNILHYGNGLLGWSVANYGDDAFTAEDFYFGEYPTIVDIHLFDKETNRLKRWELFNGEYLLLNDLVPDYENDRCFAICSSYDFKDTLSVKKRDLLIYEIGGLNQYLSVSEVMRANVPEINIYPNPATDIITISLLESELDFKESWVRIYAINGAILYELKYENNANQIEVDVSKLAVGQYFIHYFNNVNYSKVLQFGKQ